MAALNTAMYAMQVRTTSSLQAGSGTKGAYLPSTAMLVMRMSATSRILQRNIVTFSQAS